MWRILILLVCLAAKLSNLFIQVAAPSDSDAFKKSKDSGIEVVSKSNPNSFAFSNASLLKIESEKLKGQSVFDCGAVGLFGHFL